MHDAVEFSGVCHEDHRRNGAPAGSKSQTGEQQRNQRRKAKPFEKLTHFVHLPSAE